MSLASHVQFNTFYRTKNQKLNSGIIKKCLNYFDGKKNHIIIHIL